MAISSRVDAHIILTKERDKNKGNGSNIDGIEDHKSMEIVMAWFLGSILGAKPPHHWQKTRI